MEYAVVFLASAAAAAAVMVGAWRISLRVGRADVADVAWALSFVLVAWVAWLVGDAATARRTTIALLTTVWGVRLAAHLTWRMRARPEDRRYVAMRQRLGRERFERMSLWTVFVFQGVLAWIVSLPVQIGQVPDDPDVVGLAGVLGVAVWAAGMFFETVGDWQLARFKADPANEGRILQDGLWRYTRHPNYFGEFLVWWGIFLVAATSTTGLASLPGPVLMTALLVWVSGIPPTERTMRRRPGYAEYADRTNRFFPGPPTGDPAGRWT